MNSESIVKYVIEKNLFLKVVCAFVSVYSISVIFSKVSQSEWNGLMGISKFLEWVHFNALAKPIADISIFLQQTPWSGGLWTGEGGIIVTVSMVSLFLVRRVWEELWMEVRKLLHLPYGHLFLSITAHLY